ncbi:MAG TPA: amino acid adenylation domain-containing protein [Polyangiaceae bacterium]|nr:amino acid adenylation domain-containing protein [Polyangiaceae bacterium]
MSASPARTGGTFDVVEDAAACADSGERQSSETVRKMQASELEHWKRALAGVEPLALPTDRPRPRTWTSNTAFERIAFSGALLESARRFAEANATTASSVLLSALYVVLYRYTQKKDLVVGVLVEGEPFLAGARPSDPAVAGVCPVRIRIEGETSFAELVAAVSAAASKAAAHSPLPFDHPLSVVGRDAPDDAAPVVEVVFEHRRAPTDGRPSAPGLVESRLDRRAVSFELGFVVADSPEQRSGIEFSTDLFDAATMRRLFGHYATLLGDGLSRPDSPIERLTILGEEERQALLAQANAAFGAPKAAVPVHRSIEQRALSTPGAVAASDGTQTLTYRELIGAARVLSSRLVKSGVRPGSRVLVYMERSTDLVVALLAVLGAGAAYVPVDPRHPVARAEAILADATPDCVLVHAHLRDRIGFRAGAAVVSVELHEPLAEEGAAASPLPAEDPSLPAYVLYTSGSTGKPKGVVVPVSALSNLLASMSRTPGMSPSDRLLSVTTVTFDIAALEIFLPLVNGASVHLAPSDVVIDGPRLRELFEAVRPTVFQATPAMFRILVEAGWNGSGQLTVLCGGEALPRDLADALLARARVVFNVYGPTETTVWSAMHRVESGDGLVPIGRVIDRTRAYVLDGERQLVPAGVPGELWIGGDGVACGYLNRPELTAERFVSDPFAEDENARVYRTGDLVRLRVDGVLEYLGRLDEQIKLRGFRIEPGEIEFALRQTGLVSSALAVARAVAPGDVRLVAYYVPEGAHADPDALRDALRRRLPDYMVPSAFVAVASWPLTSSGKIDRKALPAPDLAPARSIAARVEPRDDVERFIASVWAEALAVPSPGVRDDFFVLGGHSLLALRILVKLEKKYGVSLPIRALLDAPTIESLAESIRASGATTRIFRRRKSYRAPTGSYAYLVPLQLRGDQPPLVCVHGAGGNVMNLSSLAGHFAGVRPFWGIQARGTDGVAEPLTRIEDMAAEYIRELRMLQPRGPYYLSGYSGGGVVAYELAQRLRREGERVAFLGLIDTYRPGIYRLPHLPWLSRGTASKRSLGYLLGRARTGVLRKVGEASFSASVAFHRALGSPVPHELRDMWVGREFLRAVEDYRAAPYDGDIVVFRAVETDPWLLANFKQLGWDGLPAHGVEVVDVPGNHDTLAIEPNASVLAERMHERLRKG